MLRWLLKTYTKPSMAALKLSTKLCCCINSPSTLFPFLSSFFWLLFSHHHSPINAICRAQCKDPVHPANLFFFSSLPSLRFQRILPRLLIWLLKAFWHRASGTLIHP